MSAGGRGPLAPRPQRRAAVAVAVLQPVLPPPAFNDADRAPDNLQSEIARRIFSPVAASATELWDVPDDSPPVIDPNALEIYNYRYQSMIPDEVVLRDRRRAPNANRFGDWDWVSKNVTLFYQDPTGSPFYLRARSSQAGVTNNTWRRLFAGVRVPNAFFRTFHLLDVALLGDLPDDADRTNSIYIEIDLVSRAPGNVISIPFDEFDDRGALEGEVSDFAPTILPNLAAQEPQNPDLISVFVFVLSTILYDMGYPRIFDGSNVRIVLTYEVHSALQDEVILLSRSVGFQADILDSVEENLQWLGLALLRLIWDIRAAVMVERYEENGTYIFHPRTIRLIYADMPQPNGQVYLRPPQGFDMPRGGCMAVHGMPKALLHLLLDLVVSHDIYVPGMFFDNNCGIREALVALGRPFTSMKDIKALFHEAATLRAQTASVPPFMRLTPQQVTDVILTHIPEVDVEIWELPSPSLPMGQRYSNVAEDGSLREHHVFLVLGYGHYFGVRWSATESAQETVDRLVSIRYCNRCSRYYQCGVNRVSHDTEDASAQFPKCKPRKVPGKKNILEIGASDSPCMVDDPDIAVSRVLRKVSPTPDWLLTPHDRVGFMDLETWRPAGFQGYHEVYAVGWIKAADPNIKPEDVVLFSSLVDPTTHNSALVQALTNLIGYIIAKPNSYTDKRPYYLYLYNGSGFDNLFILHTMASHFKLNPDAMALKDGRLMTLSYLGKCLVIRDLCLFTTCSLAKACQTYNVEDHLAKGHFDHNSITSMQVIQDKWDEIAEYLSKDLTALNMVWLGFMKATFDVVRLDPCSRITTSHLAYDYWNSTLTDQQRAKVILFQSFDEYSDTLRAYYGGRVFPLVKSWKSKDAHLPYHQMEDFLIDLDVVSLYPSAMWYSKAISDEFYHYTKRNIPRYFCGQPDFSLANDLPALSKLLSNPDPAFQLVADSSIEYFAQLCDADPSLFNVNIFGAIVCVDFIPNNNLMVPLLPHKNAKGDTAWDLLPHEKQWYVLEEILDAMFYGYKVTTFHCAYTYPFREALFDKAMGILMEGKKNCQRGDPRRDTFKLLANGTYGKHVQKVIDQDSKLIYAHELEEFCNTHHVLSIEPICDAQNAPVLQMVKLNKTAWINNDPEAVNVLQEALSADFEIPVMAFLVVFKPSEILPSKPTYLGAQVTAYSRIHMNFFLHKLGLLHSKRLEDQLFYTDTDSAITHGSVMKNPDASRLFGKELGQLDDELEGGRIIDYVALAPKTYAMVYKKVDKDKEERCYMKIRCKGFPHTKETLLYSNQPCDPTPYFTDGKLDATKLDLGQRIYEIVTSDRQTLFYPHLSTDIFRGILDKSISSMTVHFTTLRRCYFGVHALGHVSGIKHCHMHRSLRSAVWWDGAEGEEKEPHRFTHPYYPNLTFPKGHAINMNQ